MWCDGSWSDKVHNPASNRRYEFLGQVKLGSTAAGHYCDKSVLSQLVWGKGDKSFEIKALSRSVNDFQTHSVHISEGVKGSDRNVHVAFIVPTAFNPLQYINDPPISKAMQY